MKHIMSRSVILIFLAAFANAEEFGEDQIAMESSSVLGDASQYRSYLPPPSDFKFQSSNDDAIEDLPTPMKLKSSSELLKSASRTFKDGKPVVLIDKETGLPVDPEEKRKYLANPEEHQARNSYSYVNTNTGTLLFNTANPYYYLNFTDSQTNTFAALGNAALFLGSLLVLGQLPASTIGLGRSDSELAHRTGSLGRPPHDVLLPPPRVPAPANPLRKGIQSLRRGIKRVVGKRRPNNKRQGSFGPKRPKKLFSPTRNKVLNPIAGVRRLRKKVGNALKEYTYRKRGSGRGNSYRGDRRGQNIQASNVAPSRYNSHRNYPLPLPPMSDVVSNSMRNRNRNNRNKQPVYFDDLPEYGNDIYEPETGVVLEPIRPPQPDEIYYDEEEYVFNDYNDIPLAPPTPEPYNRREQKPRKRLSDTFRNNYRNDYEDELSYPRRNSERRKSGYPLALGLSSTASTTTRRPYDDLNEISSQEITGADSLDLNVSPYMKAPQQQSYNPYPTLSKNSASPSLSSSLAQSNENELPSEPQTVVKRKNNKRRKINKSRRRKIKRRPNQKKNIPRKESPLRSSYVEATQDPLAALEKIKQERGSSPNSLGSFMSPFDGDNGDNNEPTLNNPFGSNSFPTPTASWTQLSPSNDNNDERRYNDYDADEKQGSGSGYNPFQPQGYDPFQQMAKDFDGGNDEWLSNISQAFEGFSDFKKIDAGEETDLK